jgi:hypothetical protein
VRAVVCKKKCAWRTAVFAAVAAAAVLAACGARRPAVVSGGVPRGAVSAGTQIDGAVNLDGGLDASADGSGELVEIKEKLFIAQTNDVYLNPGEYLGKPFKLEGIFKQVEYPGASHCFVVRYGPGCCGYDGTAGFQVAWAGGEGRLWPPLDAWVSASGVLRAYVEDGFEYLYIALASLDVLEKRGAEFVSQ